MDSGEIVLVGARMFIGEDQAERLARLKLLVEKMQTCLEKLGDGDESRLVAYRAGTVLTFAVLKRAVVGKLPNSYSVDDWAELAEEVADYGVLVDGRQHTEFVFLMYASYIESAADDLAKVATPQACGSIRALADELRAKTRAFGMGELREPAYVEDCLWICLEAMVKLLSTLVCTFTKDEAGLVVAVGDYAVEYARLAMYREEQRLIAELLERQDEVDIELEERFAVFEAELNRRSQAFSEMVNDAFEGDLRAKLRASADLAVVVGVAEEEVLRSVEDVDSFFLD